MCYPRAWRSVAYYFMYAEVHFGGCTISVLTLVQAKRSQRTYYRCTLPSRKERLNI